MEGKARILVAEDDPAISHLVCRVLEKSGYGTVAAFSGSEALLRIEMQSFDLLVLDLMMPGMDGATLLGTLRNEKRCTIPVLVLSAKSSLTDKVELLRSGADDYMTKPFEPDEMLARVYALLRRIEEPSNRMDERTVAYKNLCMIPAARKVTVNGNEIDLTRHEYEILHVLMQSPDKVFSRETLYERVWNGGYYGEDNTVNVHVSNLRKKLAMQDGKTEYIKTVWGIGFKMA